MRSGTVPFVKDMPVTMARSASFISRALAVFPSRTCTPPSVWPTTSGDRSVAHTSSPRLSSASRMPAVAPTTRTRGRFTLRCSAPRRCKTRPASSAKIFALATYFEHDLFVGRPGNLTDDQVRDGRVISVVSPPPILQYPSRVLTHQIRIRVRQTGTEPTRAAVAVGLGDPHRVAGLPLARIGLNQEAHGPECQKPKGIVG